MSKIDNLSSFRWFNRILIGTMVFLVIVGNGIAFMGAASVTGDLTRLGNFRETEFRRSHLETIPTPAQKAARSYGYDAYSDLVIVGDSFSNRAETWADYIIEFTGMTTQVFHYEHLLPQTLVEFDAFSLEPPKLVVLQVIERKLKSLSENTNGSCEHEPSITRLPQFGIRSPVAQMKTNPKPSMRYGDYNLAFSILRTDLLTLSGQVEKLPAQVTELTRDDIFTHSSAEKMLYFKRTTMKSQWNKNVSNQILCFLESQRRIVESNGKTAFAVVLVPDKLSAYQQWISDPKLNNLSILTDPAFKTNKRIFNLYPSTTQAIAEGFSDFYLPNDTHWSPEADRQVAKWASLWLSGSH